MTEGEKKIQGVLLTFKNPGVLNNLDRLEGYQPKQPESLNEYYRSLVLVNSLNNQPIDRAWAYFMTLEKVRQYQGILVESNCWKGG
ncbi:MAG: gamma-glutamylcyclotransferase [Pleurocapsa sp.]